MSSNTFIIAEVGVNHNGSVELAEQLIEAALKAGADAIKFQTFKASSLLTQDAPKAKYQCKGTIKDKSQFDMLSRLELSFKDFERLASVCEKAGIKFLSSPFDMESIDFLDSLGVEFYKIPSGEITNFSYLREIARRNKPVIMSTGMADLGEVEDALDVLLSNGLDRDSITLLHCNTEYPTPYSDANLRAMLTLKAAFPGIRVGYSDHTCGIEVSVAAVALGAAVIEKHFTLDKNMPGPDHRTSLEPAEFELLVSSIRNVEQAMGSGIKKPTESERKNITVVRKSIVAARDIKKGEIFSEDNLTTKRPACGLSPMMWPQVIGRVARRDFRKDEPVEI